MVEKGANKNQISLFNALMGGLRKLLMKYLVDKISCSKNIWSPEEVIGGQGIENLLTACFENKATLNCS